MFLQDGRKIFLGSELKRGGEGTIYDTDIVGYVAKIYHSPDNLDEEKISGMIRNPPHNPISQSNHVSLAWPSAIIQDLSGKSCGFLMPKISDTDQINNIYIPKNRTKKYSVVTWEYLHMAARNIASAVDAVHAKHHIIGDIKSQNILINNSALITIVDTDSFQIYDSNSQKTFRCCVGSEDYTPHELMDKDFKIIYREKHHDLFGLGVIIYKLLLFEHPFRGQWKGSEPELTTYPQKIKKGYWAYRGLSSPVIPSNGVPIDIVHPEVVRLFHRCFTDGYTNPKSRPTASEWKKALSIAIEDLEDCTKVKTHRYGKYRGRCYWCEDELHRNLSIYFVNPNLSGSTPQPKPFKPPSVKPPLPTTIARPISTSLFIGVGSPPQTPATPKPLPLIKSPVVAPPVLPRIPTPSIPLSMNPNPSNTLGEPIRNLAKIILAILFLGVIVNIMKSCIPTSTPVKSSPVVNPSSSTLTNSTTTLNTTFKFPMSSCGDSGSPSDGTWHPVFIQQNRTSLQAVSSRFCKDAFIKYRDTVDRKDIQVASFRNRDKAEELAKILQQSLGAGEVGSPSP